jgi:hypothetical protein
MSKRSKTASIQKYTLETSAHAAVPEFRVESWSMTTFTRKREIAFIDRGVNDLATLLAGIRSDVESILLSNDELAPDLWLPYSLSAAQRRGFSALI